MNIPSLSDHAKELRKQTAYKSARGFVKIILILVISAIWFVPVAAMYFDFQMNPGGKTDANSSALIGASLVIAPLLTAFAMAVSQFITLAIDIADSCLNMSRRVQTWGQ